MSAIRLAPVARRWTGAAVIVLVLHGAAAWLLLTKAIAPVSLPAVPEAIMLDLAPDLPPIQPAVLAPPFEAPPPPLAPEPPPPAPLAAADVELPTPPPPPRPQPKPKPQPPKVRPPERRIERQPAPQPVVDAVERPMQPIAPAPQAAPQASARPPPPASSISPSWRGDLLGRLQRAKRYPDLARSRGDQGVATVSFTMDRTGHVLAVTLIRSSGSSSLDEEATALVRRAEPLPKLPEEIPGATITLTVPINFALR